MEEKYPVVCRVKPIREGGFAGMSAHIERTSVPSNADPKRQHLNHTLYGNSDTEDGIRAVLDKYTLVNSRSIPCAEMLLSVHGDWFDKVSPNWRSGEYSPTLQGWIDKNVEWLKETYGEGLVSAELHMDEEAPHFHAVIVPLHTYEKRFRHGSKDVTKVYYSEHFSDPAQVIAKARKEENSELTKLGRLQTEYAAQMGEFGLVRGTKNSRASHNQIKTWRKQLSKPSLRPVKPRLEAIPKGSKILPWMEDSNVEKVKEQNKEKKEVYKKETQEYIRAAETKAKDYDRMKEENERLKQEMKDKDKQVKKITDELSLAKGQIDALRNYDLEEVAKSLCFDEPLEKSNGKPRWKGAIDMVMDVADLNYNCAVDWLYNEFGADGLLHAVQQEAIVKAEATASVVDQAKPKRPLTKQEFAVTAELEKQLEALDAQKYRITLMHNDAGKTYRYGKKKNEKEEKFYSKKEVLDLVPKLNFENYSREYNIFLTPIDEKNHYILLDDMEEKNVDKMEEKGFQFSCLTYSSNSSMQGVLKVTSSVDREAANEWFKETNKEVGDPKISGFIHPFRAVGFRNVKPKHEQSDGKFPIVRLVKTFQSQCNRAAKAITALAETLRWRRPSPPAPEARKRLYDALVAPDAGLDLHPQLRSDAAKFYDWAARKYDDNLDMSRADWMLMGRLMKQGWTEPEVAKTIAEMSPGISQRHSDVARYVEETGQNLTMHLSTKPK